jgi:RimJ/RimL family protein N-acetyltransferase
MIGDKLRWGRGLGRRVSEAMLDVGFGSLALHRITATVIATNERSLAMFDALGFKREGLFRDDQLREGRYVDVVHFGLLEDEWRDSHERHAHGA